MTSNRIDRAIDFPNARPIQSDEQLEFVPTLDTKRMSLPSVADSGTGTSGHVLTLQGPWEVFVL